MHGRHSGLTLTSDLRCLRSKSDGKTDIEEGHKKK